MAFCGNCGTKVEDGKKFCPECGAPMETTPAQAQTQPQQNPVQPAQPKQQVQASLKGGADYTAQYDPADIEANKVMAVLAYILFLIPLLAAKESPYAQFHTNQGLLVFLAGIAVSILGSIIPVLGWLIILPFGCLAVAIIGIIGLLNAWKGQAKELPLIGKYRIIK